MTERETMPQRRRSFNVEFTHEYELGKPFRYRATVGLYPDGRVGELFLNFQRHHTPMDAMAQDAAIAMSLALQYGCPLDILRGALSRDAEGYAASPFGHLLDKVVEALREAGDHRYEQPLQPAAGTRVVAGPGWGNRVASLDPAREPDGGHQAGLHPGIPSPEPGDRPVVADGGPGSSGGADAGTGGADGSAAGE